MTHTCRSLARTLQKGMTCAGLCVLFGALLHAQSTTTTTTSVVATPAAPQFGETVTLVATVSPGGAVGSVSFFAEGALVGVGDVIAGRAETRTVTLPPGSHGVRAVYSGGSGYAPSESTPLPYIVTAQSGAGFAAPPPDSSVNAPYSLAVGDFNSDGIADVVMANVEHGSVEVRIGTSGGGITHPAGSHPFAVVAGDFNGDSEIDAAVANISSNTVSVLLNSGSSKVLLPFVPSAAGPTPYALAVGDFNLDGRSDLVVANSTANTVSLLLGDGDGTFQAPVASSVGLGVEPVAVAVGDFNGDGAPDVATANYVTRNVSVLLGNGDGSLQPAAQYATGSADYAAPYSVAVGDFNRDGAADLVVANYKTANVSVLLGNGDGTFQTSKEYAAGLGPRSIAVSDFNGDGIQDVAVANTSSAPGNETPATYLSLVHVLFGNGDGTLRLPTPYSAGSGPISIAVGDFNGDARADLVTANVGSEDVSFLLATAPPLTSVSLFSSPNPSTFGESVTLSADVTPATATGVVEFLDGTTIVGAAPLDTSGRAELDTILLPSGTRNLHAIYAGVPGTWQPSQSAAAGQSVQPVAANAFEPAVNYVLGQYPTSVVAGDFNGDHRADIAVINNYDNNVSVLLGSGAGTFTAATNYFAGFHPGVAAIGDFNSDGNTDLVVTNPSFDCVKLLLGKGDGSFHPPLHADTGPTPSAVAVGDFNMDGRADLAVAITGRVFPSPGTVSVLLGNGDGTFQPSGDFAAGQNPVSIAVGDFNLDDNADLAVANFSSNEFSVLIGSGNGTFQGALVHRVSNASSTTSVSVADFDGDGTADVAVTSRGATGDAANVSLGNGDGTFETPLSFDVGTAIWMSGTVGDFNGDGRADFAVANALGSEVNVLLGATTHKGAWTFRAAVKYPTESAPVSLAVADFNADGRADLAVANNFLASGPARGSIDILLGTSASRTSVSVLTGPNPSRYGQAVTLTAIVSPSNGMGQVVFLDGTTVLGVGTLNASGRAQISTSLLPAGPRAIRARYRGVPGSWLPSESAVVHHVVHAAGSTGFAAPVHYATGTDPYSVAVGDFNNDGRADVAVANVGSHNVSVLLGKANGTFQTAVNYPAGSHPFAVAVGDFNADGKADLAVANIGSSAVSTLLGNGNGTFSPPLSSPAGITPYALAVADFDADGKADLVVANSSGNAVSVLLGHGAGTFQAPATHAAGLEPVAVAVGDFNRDGMADVAAANYVTRNVSVLLGTGDGTLQPAVHYATGSADYAAPYSVAIADFNGDGNADLAVANYKTANVSVLLGTGDGTFHAATDYAAGLGPRSVAVADFNGDGIADLTVANTSSTPGNETPATYLSTIGVLAGNGDGTFQAPITHSVGVGPISLALGEFNNDGRADLAVANSSGDVTVLLAMATRIKGR